MAPGLALAVLMLPLLATGLKIDRRTGGHAQLSAAPTASTYAQDTGGVVNVEGAEINAAMYKDYDDFVQKFMAALKAKPALGMTGLDYFVTKYAPQLGADKGEWAEFGSWSGASIKRLAFGRQSSGGKKPIHGFDSFMGLPEKWRGSHDKGVFDRKGEPPFQDPSQATWHVGWFNETVPTFKASLKGPELEFMHLDADLYSSTSTIFKELQDSIAPGAFLLFDELVNYPEYKDHELKALYELLVQSKRSIKIVGFPGPNLEADVTSLLAGLATQGGELGSYPQDVLVQIL